ncbi:MAG: hypothetical protein RL260_3609 [Pseudomonadota bacterium]
MPTWIDSHCHLDAPEFNADRPAVCARAHSAGVSLLVIPAVDCAHLNAVRTLAHATGNAYALGLHPLYVHRQPEDALAQLAQALEAVTEAGLGEASRHGKKTVTGGTDMRLGAKGLSTCG